MSDIVKVEFYGDELDCIQKDGKIWVSVRRICDALGIDSKSQRDKLKNKSWATGVFITSVDVNGRNREQFFVDTDTVPMWLANIDENRVSSDVRSKLIRFQREAATALRDYFFSIPKSYADALLLAGRLEQERSEEQKKRLLAEKTIEQDRPKVDFAMAIRESENGTLLGDFAKVLCNTGEDMGGKKIFKWLRDEGIFTGRLPMQRYINAGYFVVKETTYNAMGVKKTAQTALVTGKGKVWLEKRFRMRKGYDPRAIVN